MAQKPNTKVKLEGSDDLFTIPWRRLAIIVLSLPLFGFLACVIWSIIFQFEETTATHCRVRNYLPSTSAAIANAPQRYIWRISIALHCSPRLMVALAYYNYHMRHAYTNSGQLYQFLSATASFLHFIENLALLFLTCISSVEEHDVHENLFIAFMVASLIYMLVTCILFELRRRKQGLSPGEKRSYLYKQCMFAANVISFLVAVYFFFRHNSHCEAGIYTLFSLFEYITILTNIAFHSTAILDFNGSSSAHLALLRSRQKTK